MGVPKFFRYISERYPCLSELARDQNIPDFDNLYLDMNGIIHNCSHPDDTNIHINIPEEDMFKDIFNYIDKLFFLIRPQKLFFLAVDGVAPRAKMNQQRSRRFRSAKEAELLEKQAETRGEKREHERFDGNCITPGTEFMARLQEALRYFIKNKISVDPMWQKCRIILSGQTCPGEGEHKIMDYIRYMKSQSDYNPNTRHCLYGLDADLIILGLCTHELHFVVLREEVKFGRKTKRTSLEETRFFLLHLGLLREYLELEFDELRKINSNFDIAQLIDDWVLMGFLVGNDFIPHLPCLHISSNALPLLYKTYIKVYPQLGGNINEGGKLNLTRLEKYFAALSDVEFEIFQENYADLKYFEAKQSKNGIDEAFDFDVIEIKNEDTDEDLAAFIENSRQLLTEDDDDEAHHIVDEFETYKRNYYMNKLDQNNMTSDDKREKAICYITALQWILDYYYRGVQSWDWYYPHHYAPFISDLGNFKDHIFDFNMGKPFLPFEQLLAVLPAGSKKLLPETYQELMTNDSSQIIQFYPLNFETDLNGKKNDWEAVVLIPFIDEKLLLKAMRDCEIHLTASEIERNKHGPMYQYDYHTESQGSAAGIYSFKPLYHVFCTEKPIWSNEIAISPVKTYCIELPNASRSVFFAGFPTMKHLQYDFELRHSRVKVFDFASRNENLILMPRNRDGFNELFRLAEKYINQVVFIGWPHLIKSKVVGISNKDNYIDGDGIKEIEPKLFQLHVKAAQEHLTTRMGIEFGDYSVMVHARTYTGCSYVCGSQGRVNVNDAWSQTVTAYPAQGVVAEISVHDTLHNQHKKVEQLYPANSTIFFVGTPYFGSEGTVLNPMLVYECGRLQVSITVLPEPNFSEAQCLHNELEREYVNSNQAAAVVGTNVKCLGRLTGTLLVVSGAKRTELPENSNKTNIGLQFKYPKQGEERVGYARRINNQWYYSQKALDVIYAYAGLYPMVVEYLSRSSDRNEFCFEEDLFPDKVGEGCIEQITSWLKAQEHMKVDRITCGSKTMEKETVQKILESIEQLKALPVKTVKLQVKPHLLLKPDVSLPDMYKSKRTIRLFDRVVIVRTTYMVPLGSKGTIVGIYPVSDPNPVRLECVKAVVNFYDVLFDKHVPNGNDIHGIAEQRIYKVPESSVLLIYIQENNKQTKTSDMQIQNTQNNIERSNATNNNNNNTQTTSNSIANTTTMRIAKGSADFWMPTANTKIKQAEISQMKQVPDITASDQKSVRNDKPPKGMAPQELHTETQLLKNLLGLSFDIKNPQNLKKTVPSQKPDQVQTLPQPPQGWRNDAQNAHKSNRILSNAAPQQQQEFYNPSAQSMNTAAVPLAFLAGNMPKPSATTSAIKQSYAQVPYPNASNEQMLSAQLHITLPSHENFFSPSSSNQKSAFTPLTATRTISQSQQSQKFENVAAVTNNAQIHEKLNNLALTNIRPSTNENSPPVQVQRRREKDTLATKVNANGNKETISESSSRKTVRVPKIGAKFDFAQ